MKNFLKSIRVIYKSHLNSYILITYISVGVLGLSNLAAAEQLCQDEITIVGFGDFLLHMPLQKQALREGGAPGFAKILKPLLPTISKFDLTYANLEGPVSPSHSLHGYLNFNFHSSSITALKNTGFDVVSTANNHAKDQGISGIVETIAQLKKNAMPYTGTRTPQTPLKYWSVVTNAKGARIAWLACTDVTNQIPDREGLIRNCSRDLAEITRELRVLRQDQNIHFIIVTPHWGVEYQDRPNTKQRSLAKAFVGAGADLILGSHPHVVETVETIRIKDAQGHETKGVVVYSLGNFISNQPELKQRTSVGFIGSLIWNNDESHARLALKHMGFVPILMQRSPYSIRPVEAPYSSEEEWAYAHLANLLGKNYIIPLSQVNRICGK